MEGHIGPAILLDLALPAVPASASSARWAVHEVAAGVVGDLGGVDLAVSEAVTNAVMHAYHDRHSASPADAVRVTVTIDATALVVVVADDGNGMIARPDSPGLGFGLPIMASLAQSIEIERSDGGTRVRMRFALAD